MIFHIVAVNMVGGGSHMCVDMHEEQDVVSIHVHDELTSALDDSNHEAEPHIHLVLFVSHSTQQQPSDYASSGKVCSIECDWLSQTLSPPVPPPNA